MGKSTELLKAISLTALDVILTIIANIWRPILSIVFKIGCVSLLLFLISHYGLSSIPLLHNVSYVGWFSLIVVYNLITIKYDDFEPEEDEEELDDETPEYLEDDLDDPETAWPPKPKNVEPNDNTNTSTRE